MTGPGAEQPVLVEATRGGIVESQHRGSLVVVDASGSVVASAGDIEQAVFPRSAVKAFQALPVVESGAADRFGFSEEELALCCASHGGEVRHIETARKMLEKVGTDDHQLECGGHWPTHQPTTTSMIAHGTSFGQLHNNCSGKHAGMLALAAQLGADPRGYINPGHPVQQSIRKTFEDLCDVDLSAAPMGIDGCSVPTWAFALKNQALGFARLAAGENLPGPRREAADRILAAVQAHPFMVAGTDRNCTRLMEAVPRAFIKIGAEGVYCGCVPHAGLGLALKCESGSSDAAEIAVAGVLAALPVWTEAEHKSLQDFTNRPLRNRREKHIGNLQTAGTLRNLSIRI